MEMMEYHFFWNGRFYSVMACTVEEALDKIRTEFSAKCARECYITEVTRVN